MNSKVEIYALADPLSGEIRYIGKANDSKKRFRGHLSEKRRKTPVYCWIGALQEKGFIPELRILATCEPEEWKEAERKAIADARKQNMRLLNLADGGDEPFCSTEVRASNGMKVAVARTSTPEKARIYWLKKRVADLLKDGFGSNEARQKIREAARKRPDLFGCFANLPNRD